MRGGGGGRRVQGSSIGDKSSVKRSVLGRSCKIGNNVKIMNSVIMDNVVIENGCQVQNSVVCSGVKLQVGPSPLPSCPLLPGNSCHPCLSIYCRSVVRESRSAVLLFFPLANSQVPTAHTNADQRVLLCAFFFGGGEGPQQVGSARRSCSSGFIIRGRLLNMLPCILGMQCNSCAVQPARLPGEKKVISTHIRTQANTHSRAC